MRETKAGEAQHCVLGFKRPDPALHSGADQQPYPFSGKAVCAGELDNAAKQAALNRLLFISQGWREILPSDKLRDQAETLLDAYSMRAADSLQLAAAMIWCQQKPARRTFISGNVRLCEAAAQADFAVSTMYAGRK